MSLAVTVDKVVKRSNLAKAIPSGDQADRNRHRATFVAPNLAAS